MRHATFGVEDDGLHEHAADVQPYARDRRSHPVFLAQWIFADERRALLPWPVSSSIIFATEAAVKEALSGARAAAFLQEPDFR
jgi:hypothetical protein